jgi:hypothetical protein
MKFNKWTVALAAVGVVSLASAAKAEEKQSSVLTALSSTTISGTVDTSMEWNPGTGNQNFAPYKFNSPSMADGFNLDVVQLTIEKPLDETDWAAGYRADLWFGPYANQLGTQSTLSTGSSDFAIRQAYVALRAPVGNGLDFKAGVFDSIIGYESVDSSRDPNFTRSYGHSIEPQTETGLLVSYRFCDCFSISAGVADTVGPQINQRAFQTPGFPPVFQQGPDAETYKTWMGSAALTAPDSWGFLAGSTLYGGAVNGYNSNPTYLPGNQILPPGMVGKAPYPGANMSSYYAGATVATPLKELRLGVAWDWLELHDWPGQTWAIAGYASFQATEKLSMHLRGEYLKDSSHVLFASPTDQVLDVTATIQYDLWKNVITRVEFRWDHSLNDAAAFSGTIQGVPQAVNAYMLGANIIYRF